MNRIATLLAALLVANSYAADAKKFCVYDPSGANGDAFNLAKEYKAAALGWGVDFTLKPYTDEKTAAEDFKAGQCDAAMITGVRVRPYNRFSATIEALGGLNDYEQLGMVIKQLASTKGGALMTAGNYEVVSIIPAGAVYLFLGDRSIASVSQLAGKKLATMEHDEAAKVMVRKVGASMVAADIGTFAGMFNNGSVDACYAPAVAYKALELNKGIAKKGGVARYVLSQLTLQVVSKSGAFNAEYGNKSRQWAADNFDRFRAAIEKADKSIPADKWIEIDAANKAGYDTVFQNVRLQLRDEGKVYDKTMLTILRRVRCKADGTRAECSEQKE